MDLSMFPPYRRFVCRQAITRSQSIGRLVPTVRHMLPHDTLTFEKIIANLVHICNLALVQQ